MALIQPLETGSDSRENGSPERAGGSASSLVARFDAHLRRSGLLPAGSTLTLAFSGGLDSSALLDLLCALRTSWGWRVTAAHFDHRMRVESAEDAAWVEARCGALLVPCIVGRAARVPRNEAEARVERYAFLESARVRLGADRTVTAHHADDQAETVLLRLLRGSNPESLSGVWERREPALARPLLPFHRHELAAYASDAGTPHREDPSNRSFRFTRNRLRRGLWTGRAEEEAASAACLRLAQAARRARRAWTRRLERAESRVGVARARGRIVVAAPRLSAYDDATRARLLRRWAHQLGGTLGLRGAHAACAFLRSGMSGAARELGDGIVLRREYDAWIVERRSASDVPDRPLTIAGPRRGEAEVRVGGRLYRVEWGTPADGPGDRESFDLTGLAFPVVVRGWRTGDRLRRDAGRRSLKRLFADRRVPRSTRSRLPVVVDARDVLWVPGVERSVRARADETATVWSLAVTPLDGTDREKRDSQMER